jgi:hypothetical protein
VYLGGYQAHIDIPLLRHKRKVTVLWWLALVSLPIQFKEGMACAPEITRAGVSRRVS